APVIVIEHPQPEPLGRAAAGEVAPGARCLRLGGMAGLCAQPTSCNASDMACPDGLGDRVLAEAGFVETALVCDAAFAVHVVGHIPEFHRATLPWSTCPRGAPGEPGETKGPKTRCAGSD